MAPDPGCSPLSRRSPQSWYRRPAASEPWDDRSFSSGDRLDNSPIEHRGKIPHDRRFRIVHGDATPSRARQGRHAAGRDAARHDEIEEIEVGRHVERESVARYPARDAHTNRTYLVGA